MELLQITQGRSIEQEWPKQHGETTHHLAIRVENMEKQAAEWEKIGVEILSEDNGRWIYLNTEPILGFNIELLPLSSS